MPSVAKVYADNYLDQVDLDDAHVDMGNNQVDANSFIDNIEMQFNEKEPSRYKEFISIMKAYRKSYVLTLFTDVPLIVPSPDVMTGRS